MGVFWNETYSFLSQLKDKTSNGEVYLIQCDDKIQKEEHFSVDKITDKVPEIVKINGFGGTSFNPVFKRIEELIHNGKKIGGLIYLTDGVGTCSDEKRDYPVYFVIPDKNNNVQQYLPDWIECVYLGGKLCTQ
jgi:predicted metal-dependent peptidase